MNDLMSKGVYTHTTPIVTCKGHREWIWSVATSSSGVLCSGSQDKHVIAWNPNGSIAKMYPASTGAIVALQFVRDQLYIGCEKKVVIMNLKTEQVLDATAACGNALVLCLLHDGDRLFVGYSDCKIRAWRDGQVVGTFDKHSAPVKVLAKEAHALFSGSDDQSVVRFNTNTGSATVLYQGYNGPVRALVVYKNAIYFSDGVNVRAQSVETGTCLWTGTGHKQPVFALLRHNELLVSGSADCTIIVRNIVTSSPICVINAHTAVVKCLTMRAGMLYSGSSDKTVMVWDLRDIFQKARNPDAIAQLYDEPANAATAAAARSGTASPAGSARMRANSAAPAQIEGAPTGYTNPWNGNADNGQYGQMPGGGFTNVVPGTDNYGAVPQVLPPGAPRTAGMEPNGYGALPQVPHDALSRSDGMGGYGAVPQPFGPGGDNGPGGYGQVPRPPGAANVVSNGNGAYGAVPGTTGGIDDGGGSLYASIPTGTVGETPGYGVIPSAPTAGTGAVNTAAPAVPFDAPGYAQIPTGPAQGRAGLAASSNLPHNAPGYAQIPSGGLAAAQAAAATSTYGQIDPAYRRGGGAAAAPGSGSPQLQNAAPTSLPGYATALDPRYKRNN